MPDNYASANELVRNLSQIQGWEVLETSGPFRIVRLPPPFVEGAELWVVNDRGFLWEPVGSVEEARIYLAGEDAQNYKEREERQ